MVSPCKSLPLLSKNHVWREADRAFANRLGDPDIKIHLFLGGEIMVNQALRQTIELEVIRLAVMSSIRPWKMSDLALWMIWPPPK
jgi:hypothetical protein